MKSFVIKNARFSIIEDGIIRMEYAADGRFVDERTLFALRDYTKTDAEVDAVLENDGGTYVIKTPLITLFYRENGKPFNRNNLTGRLNINGESVYWYPSKKNKFNLGGPVSTLDGCFGEMDTPEGLIARDGWHTVSDSGTTLIDGDRLVLRASNHLSDLYLFVYGNDYKAALRSYARVSGKALLPRKYIFGSWYSRWHPYSADDFKAIIREYRENDFPLDILVIDMDWHHHDWQTPEDDPHRTAYGFGHAGGNMGWTGYSWNNRLIPDPAELLSHIKGEGISVTLNDHPADGIRSSEDCYPEFARLMGLDADKGENIPFLCGDPKYMDAFFKTALEPNEEMGVDFWWLDWQQDYIIPNVPGIPGQKVLPWLNYLYYNHSRRGGKRGASYSRWGGLGDQKHPTYFSGDSVAVWDALKFEIKNTTASGNSMCFWWGHDIGGFSSPEGEKNGEMYVRWVQYGITTPSLKLHSCWDDRIDRRPWTWDGEICGAIREMFHLRSKLFPMIYSAAYESYESDVPFMRPLYFEYPSLDEAYEQPYEYLMGGNILCAPIYEPAGESGIAEREVFLPEGVWYNFFTGERREGSFTERCDLHSFPMYVRAGAPIPMQPYTERMATEPLHELHIKIFAPEDGCDESFTLYEDDGITEDYMKGKSLRTHINCKRGGDNVTVTLSPEGDGFDGMVRERKVVLEVIFSGALGHDAENGTVVMTQEMRTNERLTLELQVK